jgi:hypothetical protein
MAKYEVAEFAWLNVGSDGGPVLVKPGTVVDYPDEWPSVVMIPKDAEGRELAAACDELRASAGGLTITVSEWRKRQAARGKTARGQA